MRDLIVRLFKMFFCHNQCYAIKNFIINCGLARQSFECVPCTFQFKPMELAVDDSYVYAHAPSPNTHFLDNKRLIIAFMKAISRSRIASLTSISLIGHYVALESSA